MNYSVFLSAVNLALVGRLRLTFLDEAMSARDGLLVGLFPFFILPFLKLNGSWFVLFGCLLISPLMMWLLDNFGKTVNKWRSLSFIITLLLFGFLSSPVFSLAASERTTWVLQWINRIFLHSSEITTNGFYEIQLLLFGILIVISEANFVLRSLLEMMKLDEIGREKKDDCTETNDDEYKIGRVIGLLERVFVFIFVLLNNYAAIGFVLAAKGVTRYNNFEDRDFAEYVLIGTMLSILLALIVAGLVRVLLP